MTRHRIVPREASPRPTIAPGARVGWMRLAAPVVCVALLGTATLSAGAPTARPNPGFARVPGEILSAGEVPPHDDATTAMATIYDNTVSFGSDFYAGQAGEEAIDDVHGTDSGTVVSCSFRYYDPNPAGTPFSASVVLYDNPGGLDVGISPVAGPFVVDNLPTGPGLVSIPVANGPKVGRDLWMGVRFTSRTAGLLLHDTPAIGSSHDYYLENGGFYNFGGNPRANFCLRVVANLSATDVEGSPADLVSLAPPRPNPCRVGSEIPYSLARPGPVRLEVLDAAGRTLRRLADGVQSAGTHAARWDVRDDDGRRVPAGLYWVRLSSPQGTRSRRLSVVR